MAKFVGNRNKKKTHTQYYIPGMSGITGRKPGAKHQTRREYYGKDNWGIDRVDWTSHSSKWKNHRR